MAALSEENFGNDGAQAYLSMLTARLVATITEILANPERLELDEDGEAMFMPSVDVLALLCERYNAKPPKPATVRQWHGKYLQVYDKGIGALKPTAEFKTNRRKMIENTFRWLESLADTYWSA
jgi:hypothetical protein